MTKVRIVTDSTVPIEAGYLEAHRVRVAPINIQFGQETFREGIDITRAEFFRRIEEGKAFPQTSQPTPASFAEIYQELAAEGAEILTIAITSKLSGTYQSAVQAKEMVPQADVVVFDTLSVAFASTFALVTAVRMAEAGASRSDILAAIQPMAGMRGYLTPANLKYFQMSGRVGRLQGVLASLLNVKALISIHDGILDLQERVRTRAGALARITELMVNELGSSPIALGVLHVDIPAEAENWAAQLKQVLKVKELYVAELPCSLAVHGGPGIIGAMWHKLG